MFKITVSTTRSAMFCLAAACFASTAHADIIGVGAIGGLPATVSDALLAGARANLQRSIVTSIGSAAPTAIAPVQSTTTVANNVRLWDEVIPPAPAPKPTQAALPASAQPRTTIAVAQPVPLPQASMPQTASAMMATSYKVNAGATISRMPIGAAR